MAEARGGGWWVARGRHVEQQGGVEQILKMVKAEIEVEHFSVYKYSINL